MQRLALGLAVLLAAGLAVRASAQAPDWNAVGDTSVIELVTHDADGSVRETSVWLVSIDGSGYIRTGSETRWRANLARDPNLLVRIGDAEHSLRAEPVADAELGARIGAAMREKYGFQDRFVGWFTDQSQAVYFALRPRAP